MASFKFIDLFCGIGGFRQALESVGGTCVFSSDIDKHARATYLANYGDEPAGDIKKVAAEDIPHFNVLCAGFPCQPYSVAGHKKGMDDERGQIFFELIRIIAYHKPEVVFLENVPRLLTHDGGSAFNIIVKSIEELGYNVYTQVLAANEFGAAQVRKRLYFICIRNDLNISFKFPDPIGNITAVEDYLDSEVDEKYFINDPGIVLCKLDLTEKVNDTYRIGYIGNTSQGRRIYSAKGVTPTFVCQSRGPAGGTEAYYINGKVRRLTADEAKRIMGFPDNFVFPVPEYRALEQLGNTVVIPVIKAIAEEIVKTGVFDESLEKSTASMRTF